MTSVVNYVSSENNRYKQAKLNEVIESLNCFVSCTTNDCTVQDYGVIQYSGPITAGQVIRGTKVPNKTGIPVIADNVFLGTIDETGNLIVANTCSVSSSFCTESKYENITLALSCIEDDENSNPYYCCILSKCDSQTSCTCENGYLIECTCTTYTYDICENCVFRNIWDSRADVSTSSCFAQQTWSFDSDGKLCTCILTCVARAPFPGQAPQWFTSGIYEWTNLTCFGLDGKTCVLDIPPTGTRSWCQNNWTYCADCGFLSQTMTSTYCCTVVICRCIKNLNSVHLCMRYY